MFGRLKHMTKLTHWTEQIALTKDDETIMRLDGPQQNQKHRMCVDQYSKHFLQQAAETALLWVTWVRFAHVIDERFLADGDLGGVHV